MAAEDDLEQFLLRGLKLEKRSNLLQKLDGQHLRFVDDEDRETAFAANFQEHFQQSFEARLAALRRGMNVEFVENGFQEFFAGQRRMDDDGCFDLVLDRRIPVQKVECRVKKSGFAGSHIAGKKYQASAVENAAGDTSESFVCVAGPMDISRIGREAERILTQSEKVFVDDRPAGHRVNSKRHPSAKHERRAHVTRTV